MGGKGSGRKPLETTEQEFRVAELCAQGFSNAEIAAKLGLGFETVKTHLKKLFRKHRVLTRTQLAFAVLTKWGEK